MQSLAEIEDRWSIDDLLDANISLHLWDEVQRNALKKAKADARANTTR